MPQTDAVDYARQICGSVKTLQELINERSKICMRNGIAPTGSVEVTPSQLQVINIVRERKQVSITELANLLDVSVASTSAMVDRMVKKDLLIRDIVPQDRRKVIVRLTSTVKNDFNRIEETILSPICQLIDRIGPETATLWCDILNQMRESLERTDKKSSDCHERYENKTLVAGGMALPVGGGRDIRGADAL